MTIKVFSHSFSIMTFLLSVSFRKSQIKDLVYVVCEIRYNIFVEEGL